MAALCILAYQQAGGGWGLYVALWLVPDLTMLGYLCGKRVGALAYNSTHTLLLPLCLLGYGLLGEAGWPTLPALIWLSHIGIDRALGFGLKYPSGFTDQHFARLVPSQTGTELEPSD